ncbi:MAG: DUF4880 domain-containing protein [Sphingomonas sp.]
MSRKRTDDDAAQHVPGTAAKVSGVVASQDDRLLEEAADWLVRMISGSATADDADRLAKWRAQSTAHEAAFREVAGVRSYADIASRTRKPVDRRAILSAGGGALAVLIGIGVARPPLGLWPSYGELMADHRTPVGGRLALHPVAGVDVELSSRTAVSLIDNGRGIRLIAGETYVAARPSDGMFSVQTDRMRVDGQDAEFNVQVLVNRQRVSCVKGTVRCDTGGRVTTLTANQAMTSGPDGTRQMTVDAAKESAWRRGLLIFDGTPLAEVVEQINLYRPGRIILTDPALQEIPLNAVFHIANIDNSVTQIEQLANVRARYMAGGVVLLG